MYEIIGFTGTKKGMTSPQSNTLNIELHDLQGGEFHHGDCVGADEEADFLAYETAFDIHVHPPIEDKYRAFTDHYVEIYEEKEYLERDEDIARACQLLIACPKEYDEQQRSGTWATVRRARKLGKMVWIIYPDGSIDKLG